MSPAQLVLAMALFAHTGVIGSRLLLALYLIHLEAQPLTVGLLAATLSVFPALLAVPMGRISDRVGARLPLRVACCLAITGMLVPGFFPTIGAIFTGAIIFSVATVIVGVTMQNLVGLLSTPEDRARNFSNYSLVNSIGSFLGPVVAGFAIDHAGHAVACMVVAVMFTVPLAMLVLFRHTSLGRGSAHAAHKMGGFRELLAGPGIVRTLITGSMQNIGDTLFSFYMPIYAHSLGHSASVIGVILAMPAAAAFVMRALLTRLIRHWGEARLLAYAFYVSAFGLLLLPLFEGAPMLALLSFIFGLGVGSTGPIVTMLMFANAPPGRSGEALGLKITVNNLTKVAAPVALGSVASAFGLLPVFWITAVLMGWGGWVGKNMPAADAGTAARKKT